MSKSREAKDRPEHADLESVRTEILLHQRSFWRTFVWFRTALQKTAIWGIFFLIIYLLRDFFPLVFLVFVFSFVSASAARALGRRIPRLSWRLRVVGIFIGFLVMWTILGWILVPQIKAGFVNVKDAATDFRRKWTEDLEPRLLKDTDWYPGLLRRLDPEYTEPEPKAAPEASDGNPHGVAGDESAAGAQATPSPPVKRLFEIAPVKERISHVEKWLINEGPQLVLDVITGAMGIISLLFLATLFSFLIVFDLDVLTREVKKLENTLLHDFYRETAVNIVKFGAVVGKVIEAQAVIALVNTVLTAIGLTLLGIPNVAVLSLGVFICGFIPVAGVFISSVPICLVGLYDGGIGTFFILIGFITGIHMLEAYVLNPRIMGAALKVNPVLVLVILVIGHHAMGVWGLLLGLPICYYFFTHVIKREDREIGLRARLGRAQRPARAPRT